MTSVTIVSPDRVKGGFISESSSLWLKSSALVVQVPTTGEILTKVCRFFTQVTVFGMVHIRESI